MANELLVTWRLQEMNKQLQEVAEQQTELQDKLPADDAFGIGFREFHLLRAWSAVPTAGNAHAEDAEAGSERNWILAFTARSISMRRILSCIQLPSLIVASRAAVACSHEMRE